MKKTFIFLMIMGILFLTGCNKNSADKIFQDLTDKVNKLNSYKITGTLEVKNRNDTHNYNVEVSHMASDKFRVSLVNTANNHEQVILRNDEGIFVLTPSLNKSFKFQSDWPYNNSQIYLLGSIIDDLNNDSSVTKEEIDSKYVFTSKVNYPNNSELVKQKVTVNKDLMIEKVEVLTENDEVEMKFTVSNIDYNPTFDETYFEVNSIINNNQNNMEQNKEENNSKESNNEKSENDTSTTTNSNANTNSNNSNTNSKTEQTATIDDIIYPLYLPAGTVLEEQEKVSKTDGERVILTFGGEKGFTLVEETVSREEELTIIPTYGEPHLINDTIGSMTDNSLNWISDDIEYYIVSDVMTSSELLEIAESINISSVASLK